MSEQPTPSTPAGERISERVSERRSTSASVSVSRPKSTPARRQISSMQIVFGSILAISLLLAINFSGRIAAGRNISAQRGELEQAIGTLQANATAERAELNYVSSDAYVEWWARREGNMIKRGEVLVVPVPPQRTPAPMLTPTLLPVDRAAQPDTENWELWWGLFFDGPPPGNTP